MAPVDETVGATHWETVWTSKSPEATSWFEPVPTHSLDLIREHATPQRSFIDIGGGGSPLASCLRRDGYRDISVLDIAEAALAVNRANFVGDADAVDWIVADIIEWLPTRTYDIWHDRAVFHFLITDAHVERYVAACAAAVAPAGLLIVSTFGPGGPETCSGLPVRRRSTAALSACFADHFVLIETSESAHITPNGLTQPFVTVVARRTSQS